MDFGGVDFGSEEPLTVDVRSAELGDEAALWPLVEAFGTSSVPRRDAFAATLGDLLVRDDVRVLVATRSEAGTVVGYLLAQLEPTFFASRPVAWVQEVMVDERARGAGVGRALMAAAEAWAREQDVAYVALASRRAGGFYEALGYEPSATFYKRALDPPA